MTTKLFICEDQRDQREAILDVVEKYIMINDYDLEVAVSTDNPNDVIAYLENHEETVGLYFFDIDLGHDLSGLQLAAKVRDYDDLGKIVFVTTHSEMLYLTFSYKVEALDFIIKDEAAEIPKRIRECIDLAMERFHKDRSGNKRIYKVPFGDAVRVFPIDQIIYFETSPTPHKIVLHHEEGAIEFYERLKNVAAADPSLLQIHQSFVVNLQHIDHIDKKNKAVHLSNGDLAYVSTRKLKVLVDALTRV